MTRVRLFCDIDLYFPNGLPNGNPKDWDWVEVLGLNPDNDENICVYGASLNPTEGVDNEQTPK